MFSKLNSPTKEIADSAPIPSYLRKPESKKKTSKQASMFDYFPANAPKLVQSIQSSKPRQFGKLNLADNQQAEPSQVSTPTNQMSKMNIDKKKPNAAKHAYNFGMGLANFLLVELDGSDEDTVSHHSVDLEGRPRTSEKRLKTSKNGNPTPKRLFTNADSVNKQALYDEAKELATKKDDSMKPEQLLANLIKSEQLLTKVIEACKKESNSNLQKKAEVNLGKVQESIKQKKSK